MVHFLVSRGYVCFTFFSSICQIVPYFCSILSGDHHWVVDIPFSSYHIISFSCDLPAESEVGLSCRRHLSNSTKWLACDCVSFYIFFYLFCLSFAVAVMFFNSVSFFFVWLLLFVDISLNTVLNEAVTFSGLSMILLNLCKT